MRLNNKELTIVVNEIYERISQPIVDQNNKIKDSIIVEDDYTRDFEMVTELINRKAEIDKEINRIQQYWLEKIGHSITGYNREGLLRTYIDKIRLNSDKLAKYPTKQEIEAKIIIAGYSEIPELIAQITSMYQNNE